MTPNDPNHQLCRNTSMNPIELSAEETFCLCLQHHSAPPRLMCARLTKVLMFVVFAVWSERRQSRVTAVPRGQKKVLFRSD